MQYCSVAKNGRGQVNIFWHVLHAVYCLLGPKILVTPLTYRKSRFFLASQL